MALSILLVSAVVFAIPNSLTLQGKLTNTAGVSQSGTYNFTFRIYDAATSGNVLWELADYDITTDANGIYDVILGGMNLSFADAYYLGITVSTDAESTPRINLTSNPYAFRANVSEALNPNASYFVRNLSVQGNITIGDGTTTIAISTQAFNFSSITGNLNINGTITAKSFVGDGSQLSGISGGSGNGTNPWNSSGTNVYFNDTNARLGLGTSLPSEILTVIGNVSISGNFSISNLFNISASLGTLRINGSIFAGDKIYVLGSEVQLEPAAFKIVNFTSAYDARADRFGRANVTEYLGSADVNASIIKVGNLSNIYAPLWNFANNESAVLDNATIIRTGNLSTIFSNKNSSLWNQSGNDIYPRFMTGNVGFGTANPNDALEVVGNVRVSGSLNASSINTTGNAYFAVNSGSVGIGTINPTSMLEIQGTTPSVTIANTFLVSQSWQIRNGALSAGSRAIDIYDKTANVSRLVIQNDGNVLIGSTSNPGSNSRLFIFGGANGANVDVRGNATVSDQAIIELEGSDYDTTPNSVLLYYGGPNATGTTMGYSNKRLGKLQFTSASTALIFTDSGIPLIFGTDFTERMRITGNGSLGIGTTQPGHTLDVYGNVSIKGNLSVDSNLSVDGNTLFVDSLDNRIGIGTTNPAETLTIIGNANISGYLNISGDFIVNKKFNVTASSGNVNAEGIIDAGNIRIKGNDVQVESNAWKRANITDFLGEPNASLLRTGNLSTIFSDKNESLWNQSGNNIFPRFLTGNVGIGTTEPNRLVDISGDTGSYQGQLRVTGTGTSYGPFIELNHTGSSRVWGINVLGSDVNSGAFSIRDVTGSAERITIDTNGNVGIGTTSPNYLLQVASGTDGRSVNLSNVLYVNGSNGNVGIGTTNLNSKLVAVDADTSLNFVDGRLVLNGSTTQATNIISAGNSGAIALVDYNGAADQKTIQAYVDAQSFRIRGLNDAFSAETITGISMDLSNGNVGIGTTTPAYTLQVADSAAGKDVNLSGVLYVNGTPAESSTIKYNDGRIGIGTSSPNQTVKLHIFGNQTDDSFMGMGLSPGTKSGAPTGTASCAFNFGYGGASFGNGTGFFNTRPCGGASPDMMFLTNNAERIRIIGSSGNVGIGTTSPNYLLQVASGTDGRSVNLSGVLYVNGSSENIGIKTTTPNTALQVIGNITAGTSFLLSSGYPAGGLVVHAGSSSDSLGQSEGISIFRQQTAGSWPQIATFTLGRWTATGAPAPKTRLDINLKDASDGTDTAEKTIMTLQSDGNIGIGTTTPNTVLHANFSSTGGENGIKISGQYPELQFNITDASLNQEWRFIGGSGTAADNRKFRIRDQTGGINVITIENGTGNIGIGNITSPQYLLQVASAANGKDVNLSGVLYVNGTNNSVRIPNGGFLFIDSASAPFWGIKLRGSDPEPSAATFMANGATGEIRIGSALNTYFPTIYSGGSEIMRITTLGNVGINTTNPAYKFQVGDSALGKDVNLSGVLYVNGSNKSVGIGTTSPGDLLHIYGAAGVNAGIKISSDNGFINNYLKAISSDVDGLQIQKGDNSALMSFDNTNLRVGIMNSIPNVTFSVSGNANVSGRLSYGTLAANSPHFFETLGSPEPMCIKSAVGKYVGCMVDENFEFKCRIDDRCNIKYLESRLAEEVEKLSREIDEQDILEQKELSLMTGNAVNELGLETSLDQIPEAENVSSVAAEDNSTIQPGDGGNDTQSPKTQSAEKEAGEDNAEVKAKLERLQSIRGEIKEKRMSVREAIEKLKLEDLKDFGVSEIESEENSQYGSQATKKKDGTQEISVSYVTKVNGSVIIRLG